MLFQIPSYQLKNAAGHYVLQTPSLQLGQGEVLAITGPSGAGKSLFIKSLFGWVLPLSEALFSPSRGAYLMVQDPSLGLTPMLNLRGHFKEVCSKSALLQEVPSLLKELGLGDASLLSRQAASFSGGERQRLMLALLLIRNPQVLVCDEPASSLDTASEIQLWETLNALRRSQTLTLVFVTHQLHLIEQYADKVLMLHEGKSVFFGARNDFFCDSGDLIHDQLISNYRSYQDVRHQSQSLEDPAPELLLKIEKLSFSYGNTQILSGFDWLLAGGEWWWLVGPSGCGKTSLCRLIAGLTVPDEGKLLFEGCLLASSLKQRDGSQRQAIQYLFQHGSQALNPARTVASQLHESFDDNQCLVQYLQQLGLAHLNLDRGPAVFSLGELQRLNLIRALGRRPKLLLADELLSALDLNSKHKIIEVLDKYQADTGACIVLISHEANPSALHAGQKVDLDPKARLPPLIT